MKKLALDSKFACSGDIHLYDREIGVTVNYPQESTKNLRKLSDRFLYSTNSFMVLGGDIQHALPTNLEYMSEWRDILTSMRDESYKRLCETGLIDELVVYDMDDNVLNLHNGETSCLFSVKGNHDYNRRTTREKSFTFFDDLVKSKIIATPKRIVLNQTEIHFYHNGSWDKPYPLLDGTQAVIGIYHDAILKDGVILDNSLGKMINPIQAGIFANIDLAIINDIHMPIKPYTVETPRAGNAPMLTEVVTHGSIGRTAYNASHKRDIAYLTEIQVTENNDITYDLVELPLTPYKDLFDYEKVVIVKHRENMFEDLKLEVEKLQIVRHDPREEIKKMPIDENIKDTCINLIDDYISTRKN